MSNTSTEYPVSQALDRQPEPIGKALSTRELTELLIKHNGLHTGCYELLVEFMIGAGNLGPTPEMVAPAAIVTVSKFGLVSSQPNSAVAVNAATVNPLPKKRATKAKSTA